MKFLADENVKQQIKRHNDKFRVILFTLYL